MASAIKSIFVIEDNEDIGFILDYFLREEGFKVRLFASAEDFTNAFKDEVPDIFLVDVMLPDGDGISLCNLIKHDSRSAEVPVLIMSAHSDAAKVKRCKAEEFIPKPFDLFELGNTINYHLAAS
ncbi:MAG: response regulator [Pedobacter sp.]|nr:MAG: response regulator [Pedobacter sp.]